MLGHVLGGPTFLARARIEQARGDSADAREYYQQFLRRYDQVVPSLAHLVEEARSGVALMGTAR